MERKKLLNIIELLIVAGLAAFLVLMLTGGSSRDVPMSEIRQSFQGQSGLSELKEQDASGVSFALGMVPSDYLYFRSDEVMDVRELFIAKAADDLEMEQLETAVSGHLEEQIDNFTGYGTNQIDFLNHAISMEKGRYYFFAVGEEADDWQAAFLKQIG